MRHAFPLVIAAMTTFVFCCSTTLTAQDTDSKAIVEPEEKAMKLYRKSQAQMEEGKYDEGYATAKLAMQEFIAQNAKLPWLKLESIEVDGKRIDVHFNMGPRERKMPDSGIVRPLSFRIWSDEKLIKIIDFELGRNNGKSQTAAIGQTTETEHLNYGMLDVDSSYEKIRQKVIDLVPEL